MTTKTKKSTGIKNFELTIDSRNIATLVFDTPDKSVNVFTMAALDEFAVHIDKLKNEKDIKALFIESNKKDIFIAGADVNEIQAADKKETIATLVQKGQDIFTRLENLPFPTIAMIDGVCLGGGLEMSLACTYRVATSNSHTRIGLPEVNLGILPGFGGTQRLYPLVGFAKALELILGAKRLRGEKALKLGVVDACVPSGYLDFKKEEFIEEILANTLDKKIKAGRKGLPWHERLLPVRKLISTMAEKKVLAKTHGHYPAPLAVLRVMKESYGKPLHKGLAIEREAVTQLALTPVSRNLIDLFFISEKLKKETFSTASEKETKKIEHSAVVGAGIMGSGIGWALNNENIDVRLKDISTEGLARAIAAIRKIYEGIKKRGRLTEREIALKMDRITFTTGNSGFGHTGFLLEAVSEDMNMKHTVYREFEKILPQDAIIASNTSSLSITELAKGLEHPNRFIGMHFFNPVNRMPLVEIITGEQTDEATIAATVRLAKRMGKTPIRVGESAGFLVNRILLPYLSEAALLFEEGAGIKHVDETLLAFGMPMGPFTLADTVGVDIGEKVAEILHKAYGERMMISDVIGQMVKKGWLGRKSGLGFYRHKGRNHQEINKEILKLQKKHKEFDGATIIDRTILIMINEAARCLEENVVDNAGYLDMAMVMGAGFPPFKGGLMRHADDLGAATIVSKLNYLTESCGERFSPCDLLRNMADKNATFYGGKS